MFAHLPQLNSLRVFDAAARLLSFKSAALELNVTPTAVSHQIRTLEERLGILLFERKTRSIELTPEGEKLARVTFLSMQKIADVFDDISIKQGVLTVSTTAAFAVQWLVPRLDSFHERHPDIQVEVKTAENIEDLQKDKRIDLAIRYGVFDESIEYSTKLISEEFGMFATKAYLNNFPRIEDATLIETKWKNALLKPVSWEHYFKKIDSKKLKVRSYDQEHHVIQAALAGQGIALVSALLVQTAVEQGWLVKHPQGENLSGLNYYLVTTAQRQNSPKVNFFRQWLLEEMQTRI